jgi:hypothetical protein
MTVTSGKMYKAAYGRLIREDISLPPGPGNGVEDARVC